MKRPYDELGVGAGGPAHPSQVAPSQALGVSKPISNDAEGANADHTPPSACQRTDQVYVESLCNAAPAYWICVDALLSARTAHAVVAFLVDAVEPFTMISYAVCTAPRLRVGGSVKLKRGACESIPNAGVDRCSTRRFTGGGRTALEELSVWRTNDAIMNDLRA